MSQFSAGRLTTGTSNNAASLEIINSSADTAAFIKEIGVALNAATATVLVLGRPAAKGVTPTSPAAMVDEEGRATGLVTTALAWGTSPTAPTMPMRRIGLPATAGANIVLKFRGRGVRLAPGETFVLHNVGTVSALNVYVVVEQDIRTVVETAP